MWTRKLLKENAKIAFKRNYWICVVVSLIATLLGASSTGSRIEFDFEGSDTDTGYYEDFYEDSYFYEDNYYEEFDVTYNGEDIYFREDATDVMDVIVNMLRDVLTSPVFIVTMIIIMIVILLFSILVSDVVNVGHKRFYMENREHKTKISQVFYSFTGGRYAHTVWVMFCKGLSIFGWTLLFVIPGIIKAYSYMMIPYILAENPEISTSRAFEISKQMMKGHKWDAFVLELSFIGWRLLTTITVGIVGVLWTGPYMDATFTEFYAALKAEAFQKGITDSTELPGVRYPEFAEEAEPQF